MHASSILCTLLGAVAAASAAGTFQHSPEDPNGIYTHHFDSKGRPVSTLVMAFDDLNTTRYDHPAPPSRIEARKSSQVQCEGTKDNQNDLNIAINNLANMFGAGKTFYHSISAKYNGVAAYGCDYGHGQTYTDTQFYASMRSVDNVCGTSGNGWQPFPDAKSSYGRTQTSRGFC